VFTATFKIIYFGCVFVVEKTGVTGGKTQRCRPLTCFIIKLYLDKVRNTYTID
jgi:hypothetical protein